MRPPAEIGLALLVCVAAGATALAAGRVRAEPSSAIRSVLAEPSVAVRSDVVRLYRERDGEPLWTDARGLRPQAARVVEVMAGAPSRGLRPQEYGVEELRAEHRALSRGVPSASATARFDVMLSDRLARFLEDLHSGRVPPRRALVARDGKAKEFDLVAALRRIAAADDPEPHVAAVEPSLGVYARLKAALVRLRSLAAGGLEPHVPEPLPVLHPEDRHPAVPALRDRLAFLGDLRAEDVADARDAGHHYDAVTADAVRRFQRRHGLAVDGVVGPRTLAQLRVPVARRIRQIELSLERLRWLPDDLAERVLIVNIPEFEVHGVRRGAHRVDFRSDVVVGASARKRRTPVLRAEMTQVVFRPYWNVPGSIARGELLPKERRSPGGLARDGFELVNASGGAQPITPAGLTDLGAGRLRLRQRPGPDNALGLVKFLFPNPNRVYLHDTPAKSLFGRSRRDFSHGCIRVADPVGLAEFVLGDQGWSRQRIEAAMAAPDRRVVHLSRPITVVLFYTTAVVHADGDVHFLDDIYGLDAVLERELDAAGAGRGPRRGPSADARPAGHGGWDRAGRCDSRPCSGERPGWVERWRSEGSRGERSRRG